MIKKTTIALAVVAALATSAVEAGIKTPPGQPKNVVANIDKRNATIRWSAPDDAVTKPIKKYIVTSSPGGRKCKASSRMPSPYVCVVRNLKHGTHYTFSVVAVSNAGRGQPSDHSNEVIASDYRLSPQCGTAHNLYMPYKPSSSTELCLNGAPVQPVEEFGDLYKWKCLGLGTSATAQCTTAYRPDPSVPHAMTPDDIEYFKGQILKTVPTYLLSPSSFRVVDPIQWFWSEYYEPEKGHFRFSFESQNGFGVYLRKSALCTMKWEHNDKNGWWTFDFDSNFHICHIY